MISHGDESGRRGSFSTKRWRLATDFDEKSGSTRVRQRDGFARQVVGIQFVDPSLKTFLGVCCGLAALPCQVTEDVVDSEMLFESQRSIGWDAQTTAANQKFAVDDVRGTIAPLTSRPGSIHCRSLRMSAEFEDNIPIERDGHRSDTISEAFRASCANAHDTSEVVSRSRRAISR